MWCGPKATFRLRCGGANHSPALLIIGRCFSEVVATPVDSASPYFKERNAMRWSILPLFAVCLLIAADDKDAAAKKEREKIVGTWKVITMERDGNKIDEDMATQFSVVFDAEGKWTLKIAGNDLMDGTSAIDPTKKPKEIDFKYSQDGDEKVLKGIYELDGEKFKVCYGSPGADKRPSGFEAKAGSGLTLTVYEKEKK